MPWWAWAIIAMAVVVSYGGLNLWVSWSEQKRPDREDVR